MRRIVCAAVVLACVGLLSSCSLLPDVPSPGHDDSSQKADVEMQHIADAVKNHDAAALKKLFSPRALEKATDLDNGLAYFLSVFPSGRLTWKIEDGAPGSSSYTSFLKSTVELFCFYKVSAGGKEYDLYFADLTVNTNDPKNVGIYALGVAPYNAHPATAPTEASTAFLVWANSHNIDDNNVVTGTPGVYVPQK